MSSSPVPLKTRHVGQRCTLNLSRAEKSTRWCGVVVRRGEGQLRCGPRHLTMVHGSVAKRPRVAEQCVVNIYSLVVKLLNPLSTDDSLFQDTVERRLSERLVPGASNIRTYCCSRESETLQRRNEGVQRKM
ncbi:uncharacterized protein TNCV_2068111 [Trichonephila clavipes]|uniref:Uncharacterized protein n=1 Tax=Trichonephila clavipes TaxID=2585209 RepID=A0A8X6W354_TRICX|nr:uncharacterized protein TNCV_2068111 [Trichonephila clavipes]